MEKLLRRGGTTETIETLLPSCFTSLGCRADRPSKEVGVLVLHARGDEMLQ